MGSCLCSGLRQLVEFSTPVSTGSSAPVMPAPAAPAAMFLFMTGLVTVAGVARLQHNGPVSSLGSAFQVMQASSPAPGYLLLLSHDAQLAESLTSSLGRYGYFIECVPTARDAGALFARQTPALVLVDRCLSGWQELRQTLLFRTIPMMTVALAGAGLAEDACVSDLEHGMDSTHICEEGSRLLVAKVRALLRRSAWMAKVDPVVRAGSIELDAAGCEVRVAGQAHHLPPVQFKLLRLLMESPDIVFRRQDLIDRIWGQDYVVEEHTLDVHMFWLRRLLSRDPQGRQAIITVRGVGIKFVINREEPHSTLKGCGSQPLKRVSRAACRPSKRSMIRAGTGAAPVRVAV
jgi:DNA-binding response OmpR family regulator